MYAGKVRVRVCGILFRNDKVLLLRHEGLGSKGFIWSFPGGGLEDNEDLKECLVREFREETGLVVEIKDQLFVNEYLADNLHAIEIFFRVAEIDGILTLGTDPEMEQQILTAIDFFSTQELSKLHKANKHNIFSEIDHVEDIIKLRGYYKFGQLRK